MDEFDELQEFDELSPGRRVIEMVPIPDLKPDGARPALVPVRTAGQVEVASRIARYFKY